MHPYSDKSISGTPLLAVIRPALERGLLTALLLGALQAVPAQTRLGAGSYSASPSGATPPGLPHVTEDFSQHPVSAKWWATLMSGGFSGNLFAHPACYKAVAKGLEVGYPGAATQGGDGFYSPYVAGLTVGVEGMTASDAKVAAYSHFSVTARWTASGRTLEATMAQGLPFSYFKVVGGNASVATTGSVFYNRDGTLGITANGRNYGVFAPTGSAWSGTGTLISSLSGKDYLSVAVLPDNAESTLLFFRKYAFSHVKKTVVSWNYQEPTAMLVSTYGVETEAKEGTERGAVFALLRHHWLEAASPLTQYAYAGPRGQMKVAEGPSFSTAMRFNGILPAMPDVGRDLNVLKTRIAGHAVTGSSDDSYYAGKSLGKLADVVQLAEFAGNAAKRDEFLSVLKSRLQEWFTAGGSQQFYYHKSWGALIGYPSSFGSDARLSDHHFHFAYQLRAAAVVAQWDKEWARKENWGGMVELLIREINTWDEADPLFGRFRYFEPYEGHGWADGTGFADRGNNQESSSESMNCNAGIIQWGINTGNKAIRDLGIFMYVNEARAIEQYWWDVDGQVFPAGFNHEAVGMVWSSGGAYGTWFSAAPSMIHGINILPITPGHLYLGRHPGHILKNYAEGAKGEWQDLFLQYLAFADGDRASMAYGNGFNPEEGSSITYGYHHIQSLKAAGKLQVNIGADLPSFAVFDKGGIRTYTAFNPEAVPRLVTFTDGYRMTVPAGKQTTLTGVAQPLGILGGKAVFRKGRKGAWVLQGGMPVFDGSALHDLRGRQMPAKGADLLP